MGTYIVSDALPFFNGGAVFIGWKNSMVDYKKITLPGNIHRHPKIYPA